MTAAANAVLAESKRVAAQPGQLIQGWSNSQVGQLLAMLGEKLKAGFRL